MSLTDWQRDCARFEGGNDIATAKAHIARTTTAMRKVMTGDYGANITLDDSGTMRKAIAVMDQVLARMEKDVREANSIKKAHDDHIAKAEKALRALPLDDIGNTIAIAELAGQLKPYMRMYTPLEAAERYGVKSSLDGLRNAAIASLADDCARESTQAAGFADRVRMTLPAAAAKHAGLIRDLTTLAVAEQMERTR